MWDMPDICVTWTKTMIEGDVSGKKSYQGRCWYRRFLIEERIRRIFARHVHAVTVLERSMPMFYERGGLRRDQAKSGRDPL